MSEVKIEQWKNKLLDLGKRNRLINYKDTKSSTLRFIKPDFFEFWNNFVVKEISLVFPYIENINDENEEQEKLETDIQVITDKSIKDQQRTLRRLRERAKTSLEEQGVNVLYLGFGLLKWYESDSSNQEILSPLILVPVSLTIESITSPYILHLHEDEIIFNPTLKYKIENDFGIKIDEFDSNENEIENYLTSLKSKFKNNNRWEIIYETVLSVFSFLKINMYKDIEKNKESIMQNSIIKAIMGDSSELNNNISSLEKVDLDKDVKPIDTFQIVDADSSQQEAILNAKKGISFVLQGPPGTGKSQTITNIIAESLADGKKVLFVSEKMAALDVVYKRLLEAGLQEFCLIMHSYKANKKAILEQLDKSLKLARKKADISDEIFQKLELLENDRNKLNEYSKELFTNIEPLNKNIYEVNGNIANLDLIEDIIFDIENILETTPEKFNKYLFLLEQLKNTIGKMSEDYKDNPWNDSNIKVITNELRHNINAYLNKLIPKIKEFIPTYEELEKELELNIESSYNNLKNSIDILKIAANSPIIPIDWITNINIDDLICEIQTIINYIENLKIHQNEIKNNICFKELSELSKSIIDNRLLDYNEITSIIHTMNLTLNEDNCYTKWETMDIEQLKLRANELINKINVFNEKKNIILESFEDEILNIDYKGILNRYKTEYSGIFKVFNKNYKEDIKVIKACYKDIGKKIKDDYIIEILQKLKDIHESEDTFQKESSTYKEIFNQIYNNEDTDIDMLLGKIDKYEKIKECINQGTQYVNILEQFNAKNEELSTKLSSSYKGLNSDWNDILSRLEWAKIFKEQVDKNKIGKKFIEKVCHYDNTIKNCTKYIDQIEKYLENINEEYTWFIGLFEDKEKFNNTNMFKLVDRLEKCSNELSKLEEWIDYKQCKEECIQEGLQDYVEKIDELNIETSKFIPIFKKRFYRLWLDAVLPKFPAISGFRRKNQENTIKEFAQLDKLQFNIARARIQKKLIDNLPAIDRFSSGRDEVTILKRELGKQRKIMPIRKLFKEIPNLVLNLKPCLMMSPLSVSMFLDSDIYKFDIVIFDEASQVCTENAIGAIARGKQVIIAGDSKQLPPTNFFNSSIAGGDYDSNDSYANYDDEDAYESILDEAALLPEKTLLWHYRSRNEHLIAFSNAKIYKNNLVTFPSNIEKEKDNGVEYVYVKDGIYDRGGQKGNEKEAQKVAELVFEHFKKFPERSLGVIAFGEVQQQAIEMAVRKLRLNNQEFEQFFKEDNQEAFFIKNLENVQGDERDTIIFSIGFAQDSSGKMLMQFGPLSRIGGERRLNVAITRAKYNVKLVGSIMPTDIEIEKISTDGPKLLRSYIEFAINGIDYLKTEITETDIIQHDSPFEKAVYNFLVRKGYKVVTQVGCSGYKIDMAVKHPTISGRYILGIECDGASYHSARTARERDRLRQDILENMGWKIYRIWSTDWIKDSVTEGNRLIEAIEEALSNNEVETIEKLPNGDEKKNDFLKIENKVVTYEEKINPYGFKKYVFTDIEKIPRPYNNDNEYLKKIILEIVNTEYPVCFDFICKKVAYLFGNEKVTVKVRNAVKYIIDSRMKQDIYEKAGFYLPYGNIKIEAKIMSDRPIEFISIEELADAMITIVDCSYGITKESLLLETAKVYGFNHRGAKLKKLLEEAYIWVSENGRLKEVDGKIIINNINEVKNRT